MIDVELLNKFFNDANVIIKKNEQFTKLKPLCSVEFSHGNDKIVFSIEMRGFVRDENAFFLVATLNDSADKFIARGYFTSAGHHTDFKMSHYEPRGMSIQQGILIEMKNIVNRLLDNYPSDFLRGISNELSGMKVKVVVVESDDDKIDESEMSRGKLNLKGESQLESNESSNEESVEDTIGETFAKSVGNKSESPDEGNIIDEALKDEQEYVVKKESLWSRIKKFFRKLFGLNKEEEALESLFDREINQRNDEKQKEEKEK